MARPRKGSEDQRCEMLRFRLRPSEYLRIRTQAERAQLSLSDYSRALLLKGSVSLRQTRSLEPAAFEQLRRIGINLNQAVHKLHSTGKIPPELASAAQAVERVILGIIGDGP